MQIIAERISRNDTDIYMPNKKDIHAKISLEESRWHHATGKKTKGHDGS
jgi:hypothetical protein